MDQAQTILTRDPAFGKLGREIARFANHTQRYVRASQTFRATLESAAEWSQGAAPLDRTPEDPAAAFTAMDGYARTHRQPRQNVVGAYFAHQHLRIQAEMARGLLRESFNPDPGHRVKLCRDVYFTSERVRRGWVSAFLDTVVASTAPELNKRDFVALNVGSLTDHEDVDLAVVCVSDAAKQALSRGFAGVAKTFVRFASKIQMFLTEELSNPTTGALVEEYAGLLKEPNRNVVSVMQLLGAQYLCGNPELERNLKQRVTSHYFVGTGNGLVHEGFMRAIMNELRVHLRPTHVPRVMAPKREVYIPAKLACSAARVVHNVDTPLVPEALEELARHDGPHGAPCQVLAETFVQTEVLRALVFLYVFQGDELDLTDEADPSSVRRVALLFGLGESARKLPENRLLGTYAELRARTLTAVRDLSWTFERHLKRISTFRRLMETETAPDHMALQLLEALEHHRGGVFWDEVVRLISESPIRRRHFVEDFESLPARTQDDVARRYVAMMVEDAASLVEFLVFLAARVSERSLNLFWRSLLEHFESNPHLVDGFIERLDAETRTEALFRLAVASQPGQVAGLADFLERIDKTMRSARVVRSLRSMVFIVHHRSNAIGRIVNRVLARSPEFLRRLGDSRRLRDLTIEIMEQAATDPDPRAQVELIGDSFDVAVLRASLLAVLEGAPSARDHEFTAAVDKYVRELFKACFREVRQRSPLFELYRPGSGIAVFATGGYGRGEAFGGDFDYIAVVDQDDPGLKKFFGKVLQRVSAAMSKRGLHPHNRLTDLFNAWAVSIPELVDHLKSRNSQTFIDEAEVLESRFFLGEPMLARQFAQQVQGLVLGPNRRMFTQDVLTELRERRPHVPPGMNLKEGRGGLRELHLLFLALRAFARLPTPFGRDSMRTVVELLPHRADDLESLISAHHELRRTRELYRLSVAFDDSMEPDALARVADELAPFRRAGIQPHLGLQMSILMDETARAVDRVSAAIARVLATEA
ncbi:MAG: hypothetical protein ACFB9M_15760 [Myxococcota bacterium]